ncbi:hypothetical protein FQN53_000389 [Emmonsiellopsis sp. PD_33]|nr:hypothetical protein FQN53_000389 [Emmonsiellopsis sp. PD_33]
MKDGECKDQIENENLAFALYGLHLAAFFDLEEPTRTLLASGTEIEAVDNDSWTLLMLASGNGHISVVHALLENGEYVSLVNSVGETALFAAIKGGNVNIVRVLPEHGADVNTTDRHGKHSSQLQQRMNTRKQPYRSTPPLEPPLHQALKAGQNDPYANTDEKLRGDEASIQFWISARVPNAPDTCSYPCP